jgi:hypothetical protein
MVPTSTLFNVSNEAQYKKCKHVQSMLWRNSHSRARANMTFSHEKNLLGMHFEIIQ